MIGTFDAVTATGGSDATISLTVLAVTSTFPATTQTASATAILIALVVTGVFPTAIPDSVSSIIPDTGQGLRDLRADGRILNADGRVMRGTGRDLSDAERVMTKDKRDLR